MRGGEVRSRGGNLDWWGGGTATVNLTCWNRREDLLEPATKNATTGVHPQGVATTTSCFCYHRRFLLLHACTAVLVDSGNVFLFCCSRLRVLLEPVYNFAGTSFFFFRR